MFVCIPYSMIEPIKENLASGIHGDNLETDHRWAEVMKEALKETRVRLSVDLGRMDLTFRDIMQFEPGNILNLGKSVADDLLVTVEGTPKFRGKTGNSRGNQAIKVTGFME